MFLDSSVTEASFDADVMDAMLCEAYHNSIVDLTAAYNDMMLESFQIQFSAMTEGVEAINEGVIDIIKNFFKKIFNAIAKLFKSDSGSDSGSGMAKKIRKELEEHKDAIDAGLPLIADSVMLKKVPVDDKAYITVDSTLGTKLGSVVDDIVDGFMNSSISKRIIPEELDKLVLEKFLAKCVPHWKIGNMKNADDFRVAYAKCFGPKSFTDFAKQESISIDFNGLSKELESTRKAFEDFNNTEKSILAPIEKRKADLEKEAKGGGGALYPYGKISAGLGSLIKIFLAIGYINKRILYSMLSDIRGLANRAIHTKAANN